MTYHCPYCYTGLVCLHHFVHLVQLRKSDIKYGLVSALILLCTVELLSAFCTDCVVVWSLYVIVSLLTLFTPY